jgi:hypothetical protein
MRTNQTASQTRSSRTKPELGAPIDLLRVCCQYRPFLGSLIDTRGQKPLSHLYREAFTTSTGCTERFREAGVEVARDIFGDPTATDVEKYLKKYRFVDVGQHHQLHSNPMSFQAALLGSLSAAEQGAPFSLVLGCSGIPLGNKTFPAGFEDGRERYRLFSKSMDERLVFRLPPTDFVYRPPQQDKGRGVPTYLGSLLEACRKGALGNDFATQVSLANRIIWRQATKGELPEPLFIPQERVVLKFLERELQQGSGFFFELLTRSEFANAFSQSLADVVGCHTALFWLVAREGVECGKRWPLTLEGDRLVSPHRYMLQLSREELLTHLSHRTNAPYILMPHLGLLYTVMLSQGLNCYGGFNQISYLPEIFQRIVPFFDGYPVESHTIKSSPLDCFIRGPILSLNCDEKGIFPAAAHTFLRRGVRESIASSKEFFLTRTVFQALLLAAPEIFDGAVPHNEKCQWPGLEHIGYAQCADLLEKR